jgi:hypothetical protein
MFGASVKLRNQLQLRRDAMRRIRRSFAFAAAVLAGLAVTNRAALGGPQSSPTVTFLPYIQPGDNGEFGATDQMLVAWQTNEKSPNPSAFKVEFGPNPNALVKQAFVSGRVVDNYLSVDPQFAALNIPTAYGAHTDYSAVLSGLEYDHDYYYRVSGPGIPNGQQLAHFHARKRGNNFSFQVVGDEGFYPFIPNSPLIANYEARIIHTMFHVDQLQFPNQPGQPQLPKPDFALNTGDNVYTVGSDANYRDWWMGDWNSTLDTNDDGAPFIRYIPFYIVVGNHDCGSTGASANLLADNPPTAPGNFGPGVFGGGVSGGDALAHFNNFYFPLNGPAGVDIQSIFNHDAVSATGLFFTYQNVSYNSPAAIEAYRASTAVDSGKGVKRQIDHESNYSFDYGSAHVVFLDANPHLFNSLLPGGNTYDAPTTFPFPEYPTILKNWLINDLDSSNQSWKVVVFHQPSFSSGNATLRNDQMRRVAKLLEDHGVNIVFNGHEHNYQRTLPIRALDGVVQAPAKPAPPAVDIDTQFDGNANTVPDGVLYIVEGAGGNRDFDDNTPNPRGGGTGIDQDDNATGTFSPAPGKTFPNGPDSWLDTNLTNTAMSPFITGAGTGPKITVKFKSKIFSFADIIVNDNVLTLYQITEPLGTARSGNFGTDVNGKLLNDPLPDTTIDPTTGNNVQTAGQGTPAMLDRFTITRPDVRRTVQVNFSFPKKQDASNPVPYTFTVSNSGAFALNAAQVVFTLPDGASLADATSDTLTLHDSTVVITIGRLASGETKTVQVNLNRTSPGHIGFGDLHATVRSSTAQSVPASPGNDQGNDN